MWVSINEVAAILEVSPRLVSDKARQGYFISKRKKKQLFIESKSLPLEVQRLLISTNEGETARSIDVPLQMKTPISTHTIDRKRIVEDYLIYRSSQMGTDDSIETITQDFIRNWNKYYSQGYLLKSSTLYYWMKLYKEQSRKLLSDGRGGHNKGIASIPPAALEYFVRCYLNEKNPSISNCCHLAVIKYHSLFWDNGNFHVPCLKTFERVIQRIPAHTKKLFRNPPKYQEGLQK
ncbi:MAG TPA: hypothetical protein DD738_15750 [Ruminiclostridium sp.]|jgi:hypothetical protein|nr:hypothetical protein [Bacillota bacterium]HBR04053.1 hypothetical protein [Ruminiclostridium sp.]